MMLLFTGTRSVHATEIHSTQLNSPGITHTDFFALHSIPSTDTFSRLDCGSVTALCTNSSLTTCSPDTAVGQERTQNVRNGRLIWDNSLERLQTKNLGRHLYIFCCYRDTHTHLRKCDVCHCHVLSPAGCAIVP